MGDLLLAGGLYRSWVLVEVVQLVILFGEGLLELILGLCPKPLYPLRGGWYCCSTGAGVIVYWAWGPRC